MKLQHQQIFGSIVSGDETFRAMLCVDDDCPTEFMIHWWPNGRPAAAILADGSWVNNTLTLIPRLLFKPSASGAISLPAAISDEETSKLEGTRAVLTSDGKTLKGSWTSLGGTAGTVDFNWSMPPATADLAANECNTWGEFKDWSYNARTKYNAALYRGHGDRRFSLKTTLQRAGRNRVDRYCAQQLNAFRVQVEATLGIKLDMEDGDDYGTLLGLAQHHGLPTPMLDWTASPYIAAFFAFADALESLDSRPDATHVRIYALTHAFTSTHSPNRVILPQFRPYASCLSISARLNPRMHAQQGQFLVTNIANLEPFIRHRETERRECYLLAADVPIGFAIEALEDLSFMGLTASTMFPGLDGAARTIRHSMEFTRKAFEAGSLAADDPAPPKVSVLANKQDGLEA